MRLSTLFLCVIFALCRPAYPSDTGACAPSPMPLLVRVAAPFAGADYTAVRHRSSVVLFRSTFRNRFLTTFLFAGVARLPTTFRLWIWFLPPFECDSFFGPTETEWESQSPVGDAYDAIPTSSSGLLPSDFEVNFLSLRSFPLLNFHTDASFFGSGDWWLLAATSISIIDHNDPSTAPCPFFS